MYGRLKDYRGIATRYDHLTQNCLTVLCIAATIS